MRAIITADWHIRATRPRCRTDEDWIETQRNALSQIAEISSRKECDVLVVGDLFDKNSDTTFECINLVQRLGDLISENGHQLGILAGNHDLPYHSSENINKSAIGVLLNGEKIKTISKIMIENYYQSEFSAGNFDEETKNVKYIFKHILTFPEAESKPPMAEGCTAEELLERYNNAKWIFTGDYHGNFHYENNGRHVVNSGCLLRQVSDKKDYQCGVYYVDTNKNIVEFIPIHDNKELVDDSYILANNEREDRINKFVDKLMDTNNVSLDFISNVESALLVNKIDKDLKQVIMSLTEV